MSEERCESCSFWRLIGAHDIGECRRRPPVIIARPPFDGEYQWDFGDVKNSTVFPITCSDDWCGEYQARVPLGMVQISPELDFGPPDVGAKVGRAMVPPGE